MVQLVAEKLISSNSRRILDVPFTMADATTTEAGYVGEDVENIILKLLRAADYNVEKAQRGIVYIDEVDKISRKSKIRQSQEMYGKVFSKRFLVMEGTIASVPPQGEKTSSTRVPTSRYYKHFIYLWWCFCGLDKIIEEGKAPLLDLG